MYIYNIYVYIFIIYIYIYMYTFICFCIVFKSEIAVLCDEIFYNIRYANAIQTNIFKTKVNPSNAKATFVLSTSMQRFLKTI